MRVCELKHDRQRSDCKDRKEKKTSIPPLSLLCTADKFLKFTFLGMSCGYHFIIIVNRSTAFEKKKKKTLETIKAILN